jgi:hypothetical protein
MDANRSGPTALERKLDALSASIDRRFDAVDKPFEAVIAAIVEQRQYTEFAFGRLDTRLERVERKLDQFIDVQMKTNELVERRLQRLEGPDPGSAAPTP